MFFRIAPFLAAAHLMAADAQVDQFASDAELLKEVKVPAGFDATIFAAPPMANYPVFIAAAPDGTLYVSSDGNGSLGKDPHRGRILRLRDLNDDGRADEVKEFVKDVDSPRGLVWDHDRLYLLHPPHISEFIDRDGDGISDESRVLVKNIGWALKDRPADHASNGLTLGIDGWLYCAIGDFGFMEAEGTDGRKLQLRGGGVVRVRPDGTGLHLYSRGTRNILEVAVSPTLDLISRDNTNDGDGWDIRLHHNTGFANHGYPSQYKNFPDEIIQPLADYGGGSGCGAAWIDEPGLPSEWNNAAFTADWGRGWIFSHRLTENGATFSAGQKEFVSVTRPTDLDADGMSRIYVASWRGATFNWVGPNVGYIVQMRPKGYTAPPIESKNDLITLGDSSHRRRLAAQRRLLKNGCDLTALRDFLSQDKALFSGQVAGVFLMASRHSAQDLIAAARANEKLLPFVIRALGEPDRKSTPAGTKAIVAAISHSNPAVRLEAISAAGFQKLTNAAPEIALRLGDADRTVAHTASEVLKRLGAAEACWPAVDASETAGREGALRTVQGIHRADVVDALRQRLLAEKDPARRIGLFRALARLHFQEGQWKGDSWGTRPDSSGPYYQAETWSESPRILSALEEAVSKVEGGELAAFVTELNRHKIQSEAAAKKIIAAAETDASLLSAAIGQIGRAERASVEGETLLVKAARAGETQELDRAQAVSTLAKIGSEEGLRAGLLALAKLEESKDSKTEAARRQARNQLLNSQAWAKHIGILENDRSLYADAALASLAGGRNASPEAKAALDKAWSDSKRKPQLLRAMAMAEKQGFRDKVLEAAEDSDPVIAEAAKETARALRLERPRQNLPKIEAMKIAEAISSASKTKGDIETGKRLFTQLTCVNCHTVSASEAQRGPYLGNIAATYRRAELAEAILVPNKSLAQGFVANRFELKDGGEIEGFVTLEAADKVVIRNVAAQEITIPAKDIVKRLKLEKSLMPEGLANGLTVQEFAGLLDYLESLTAK